MAVPIDPAILLHARPLAGPFSYTSLNTCKQPPANEQMRCVGTQLLSTDITKTRAGLIDLGSASSPPISQMCSIYIDNTNNNNPITFAVEGSGFSFTVDANDAHLLPIFSDKALPKLYIMGDISLGLPSTKTPYVNLFILNQYVPSISNLNFTDIRRYGTAYDLTVPNISMPAETEFVTNSASCNSTIPQTLLAPVSTFGNIVYNSLQLILDMLCTDDGTRHKIFIQDFAGNLIKTFVVYSAAQRQVIVLCAESGLNNATSPAFNGNIPSLFCSMDSTLNVSSADIYINATIAVNNSNTNNRLA